MKPVSFAGMLRRVCPGHEVTVRVAQGESPVERGS